MSKVNDTAQAIVSNIHKFQIGETYTFKQICDMCGMKVGTGNGKIKQINTLKELFDIEEGKVGRVTIYTILAINKLSDEELASIVSNKRGKSEGSRGNNDIYCSKLSSNLINSLRDNKDFYLSNTERYLFEEDELLPHEFIHKLDTMPFRVLDDEDTVVFNLYRNQIIQDMGIRNDNNFKIYSNTPNYFCEYNSICPNVAKVVYPSISKATHRAFESQIKKFKSEGLGIISKRLEIEVVSEYDSYGRKLDLSDEYDIAMYEHNRINHITMFKLADDDTKDRIDLIKTEVAKEFKYKTVQDLYTRANVGTKDKFHIRVKEVLRDRLGIYDYRPFVRITTSLSMLDKHKSKFGSDEGLIAFTGQIMKAIKGNAELFTDEEARQNRFKKKLAKKINNPKIYYDLIQQEEFFIPQATKFVDLMLNPSAKHTPKKDNDIPSVVVGSSKLIFEYNPTKTEDIDYSKGISDGLSDEAFFDIFLD